MPGTQLLLSAGFHADIGKFETDSGWQHWQKQFVIFLYIKNVCLLAWQRDRRTDIRNTICVMVENVFLALETVFKVSRNTDCIFKILVFFVGHS